MRHVFRVGSIGLAALALSNGAAWAHLGQGATAGLGAGFAHPLGGLDHALAMVAVGLWAARLGGRAVWGLPLAFLAVMALAALAGTTLGGRPVEFGIAASVLLLGGLIAWGRALPLFGALALVGLFAALHGHAHGAEMAAGAAGLAYAAGFLLASAALHALGLGLGLTALRGAALGRVGGGAVAAVGVFLLAV